MQSLLWEVVRVSEQYDLWNSTGCVFILFLCYIELYGDTNLVDIQQYQDYQLTYCPQVTNLDFDETVTGTLTFNEDGSRLNDFTISVDYLFTWSST